MSRSYTQTTLPLAYVPSWCAFSEHTGPRKTFQRPCITKHKLRHLQKAQTKISLPQHLFRASNISSLVNTLLAYEWHAICKIYDQTAHAEALLVVNGRTQVCHMLAHVENVYQDIWLTMIPQSLIRLYFWIMSLGHKHYFFRLLPSIYR